jgi:protein TonB
VGAETWRDNPWERLPWTGPLALLASAALLAAFVQLLSLGRLPEAKPPLSLDAQIVVVPGPARPAAPPAEPPPAAAEPPPPVPEIVQPPEPPIVKPEPPPRPKPRAEPRPAPTARPAETPAPQTATPVAPPSPAAPSEASRPIGGGQAGARAIYKPLPEFPAELRRQKLETVAIARFHVAVDGSADVEIVQATDNVALNRLLLNTFKTWRFFPATENGQPVTSTIEIRVPISVQ